MSRGLGKLQRAIMEALEPAKQQQVYYRGSAGYEDEPGRGWVAIGRGQRVRLAEHVYDLRAVSLYLSHRWPGGRERYGPPVIGWTFRPRFSRAVRGLVARGLLAAPGMVPLAELGRGVSPYMEGLSWHPAVLRVAEGLFLSVGGRRFVIKR